MGRKKYELYYTLNTNVPDRAPTATEKRKLEKDVASLDGASQEAFVLLIYEHHLVETKADEAAPATLPYGGRERKTSVSFDLAAFPPELVWILAKFVAIALRLAAEA